MAQVDTGLGWSAKDDWLTSVSGDFWQYGDYTGGLKLPVAASAAEAALVGITVQTGFTFGGVDCHLVVAASEDNCYLTIYSNQYHAFSRTSGPIYYQIVVDNNGTVRQSGTYNIDRSAYLGWYQGGGRALFEGTVLEPLNSYRYAGEYQASAALVFVGGAITKSNAGYAVGCTVYWKTPSNVIIKTPILISSEPSYVDMLAGSYNFAKYNGRKDGLLFYMGFFQDIDSDVTSNLPFINLTDAAYQPATLDDIFHLVMASMYANVIVTDSSDPYEDNGGGSEEDGGDGNTVDDDPVTEQTLPLPSVTNLGFCTIYVPTASELMDMANYLWSGNFDIENVIRLFSNPLDSVIGLSAVPVDLAGVSPAESIHLGGVQVGSVTMHRYAGRTSVPVDFGTVSIKEKWGSYLDYTPYTEFSIYLPFIGIKNIKADDIMGKTLSLKYYIDIVSGGCIASLRVNGGSVIYEYSGQCALQIPITSQNYDNIFNSAISAALALTSAFSPSASGPVLAGAVASAATQNFSAKPSVSRSGGFNGITGFLGQLQPYILRTMPKAYIPNEQNKFIGYPSFTTKTLGAISGYNEIASIHLENIPATGAELTEIEDLLKGGVIL